MHSEYQDFHEKHNITASHESITRAYSLLKVLPKACVYATCVKKLRRMQVHCCVVGEGANPIISTILALKYTTWKVFSYDAKQRKLSSKYYLPNLFSIDCELKSWRRFGEKATQLGIHAGGSDPVNHVLIIAFSHFDELAHLMRGFYPLSINIFTVTENDASNSAIKFSKSFTDKALGSKVIKLYSLKKKSGEKYLKNRHNPFAPLRDSVL